ncbi:hypothetical protein RI129_002812 [Pyrocoelia pectoralis]|uniref:DDE Tnp4 domain-containing protein n=1 Tax=Pyrocoelia pectoralis TaxID=417401 RepID=A0AAN7VFY5_9COLE
MSRWRLLTRTICCTPDNAICIVQAMVCLHNFIMSAETDHVMPQARLYCPPHFIDYDTDEHDVVEGQWRTLIKEGQLENFTRLSTNNAPRSAATQRNVLRDYFVSVIGEHQAPWQYRCAFKGLAINVNQ